MGKARVTCLDLSWFCFLPPVLLFLNFKNVIKILIWPEKGGKNEVYLDRKSVV